MPRAAAADERGYHVGLRQDRHLRFRPSRAIAEITENVIEQLKKVDLSNDPKLIPQSARQFSSSSIQRFDSHGLGQCQARHRQSTFEAFALPRRRRSTRTTIAMNHHTNKLSRSQTSHRALRATRPLQHERRTSFIGSKQRQQP